jgi:acyl carrier protein
LNAHPGCGIVVAGFARTRAVAPGSRALSAHEPGGHRMADLENKIAEFIVRNIMLRKDPSGLGPEDPLLESGIINSFGIVELVAFIEKEFGITVPDRDVVPENFDTVRSISKLVKSKT